ncbi:MAG TPA: helix-turn-helix transcriptional regulator [Actinomycetota bacterium]|nr:helix-turn-helix transcriptional regulator [Actinomycetota bacterium]
MARRADNDNQAIYIISVAAELAGVHPQTLRVYERKGLLSPSRTSGNTRRYSQKDIDLLRRIQELTNEGVNLAGVMRILELEDEIDRLRTRATRAAAQLEEKEAQLEQVRASRSAVALVPLKDIRRVRRAMKADELDEAGRRRTFEAPPVS